MRFVERAAEAKSFLPGIEAVDGVFPPGSGGHAGHRVCGCALSLSPLPTRARVCVCVCVRACVCVRET